MFEETIPQEKYGVLSSKVWPQQCIYCTVYSIPGLTFLLHIFSVKERGWGNFIGPTYVPLYLIVILRQQT